MIHVRILRILLSVFFVHLRYSLPCFKKTIHEIALCHLFEVLDLQVEAVIDIDLAVIHHNLRLDLGRIILKNLISL